MVSLGILLRTKVFWMIRGSILAKVVVLVILFDNETLCFKVQINFICKALLTA